MSRLSPPLVSILAAVLTGLTPLLHAHPAADEMAAGARAFLDTLTQEQRTVAVVPLDSEVREDWHYVPRHRAGLPLRDMTQAQRTLALDFVRTGLSARGFEKVSAIVALETVLAEIEGRGAASTRDPGRYYLLIAGAPEPHGTWAWRFEGHHLSLNITIIGGEAFAVTPSFLGANPAEIPSGPHRGERILADEEDLARALMLSLDEAQRSSALIARNAPSDILTGAARRADPLAPTGIAASALNESQQTALLDLIGTYVGRHRADLAARDLEKIRAAGIASIHFAWAGSLERGQGHYYRVQGPTFILEYDNTQNGANHIHAVWRDFEGDFGRDLLREHIQRDHAAP